MSVIVCAYNEEAHIAGLLRSLTHQTVAPHEVVVVDDGSTDTTAAVAAREGAQVLRQRHQGPAVGRNVAAAAATGDILVFLDGDMSCTPNFLERLAEPMRSRGVVGTFTREIFVANMTNRWAASYAVIRQHGTARLLPHDFPDEWDNFRAIRSRDFLEVGGYDDIGYGEDRTLARKLGLSATVAEGAVCHHFNPSSPREIFSNGRWIGRGAQIRELTDPWSDHLPARVARWIWKDRRSLPLGVAACARLSYHGGVLLGLTESVLRPDRHWK